MSGFVTTPTAPALSRYPWVADQGDGTFVNPLLWSDVPDPDVIRDGADYFLVASSFHCTPGLPIYHSRDLVNWTIVNHALQNLPHPRYERVHPGCGVWAPAIRKHAGRFWIFFPTPDEGIYCTTADHPTGQWSSPHLVRAGKGLIDPCPLWDDDGKAYLVHAYAGSRAGIKHMLRVCPMSPDGSVLLGEGQIIFEKPDVHPTLEGPKFLKRDGYYYVLAPAGGVKEGWQLALRSRHIYGPYEEKIILEQGSTATNGPHQGALVDTPAGEWWFVHFQDADLYGRVPHLQPVHWENGWPLIGIDYDGNGVGEPVARYRKPAESDDTELDATDSDLSPLAIPQTADEFDDAVLGHQWHWNANHRPSWISLTDRPGWLRLFAAAGTLDLLRQARLLMQNFPARAFLAETLVELSPAAPAPAALAAGLAIVGRQFAALVVTRTPNQEELSIELRIDDEIAAGAVVPLGPITLRVNVADGGLCSFSYQAADEARRTLPGTFQAVAGYWVGAKVGLFAVTLTPTRGSLGNGNGHASIAEHFDSHAAHADFAHLRFKAAAGTFG